MASKLNVLVYSGIGTTIGSVQQALYTLRRLLSPTYSVAPVTADTLTKEPWQSTTALIVFPGGADLGYCRALNGEGNRRITLFVRRGGGYLGFCAGGYYGSSRVEFEVDDPDMAVVGSRELAFFPGTCRGCAFSGFKYGREDGARAAKVKVEKGVWGDNGGDYSGVDGGEFVSYYNGGGVFVDADKFKEKNVEVLARYEQSLAVEGGDAAAVHIRVGEGNVVLTGPHPEFAGVNMDRNAGGEGYPELVDSITRDHDKQVAFLRGCLSKLGLRVSENVYEVPALTPLHLTAIYPEDIGSLVTNLRELVTKDGAGQDVVVGENDTFVLKTPPSSLSLESLSLQSQQAEDSAARGKEVDEVLDYTTVPKTVYTHTTSYPSTSSTPYFNHITYYKALLEYRSQSRSSPSQFGSFILYGEVLTSTSTLLDKNYQLLDRLPNGLTAVATLQVAGRGRGTNAWVSPLGSLVFSTIIRHPMEMCIQAPVVFIQYLTGMAIVEAIRTYGPGYSDIPVKLKWPNDIYAEDPTHIPNATITDPLKKKYVKICGILVTSSYSSAHRHFNLVVGCGINVTNRSPTTSLNHLLERLNASRLARNRNAVQLQSYVHERLFAKILVIWEEYYYRFCQMGFRPFEEQYYRNWMHSGQVVRLEMEGGAKARIKGVTLDHGLLRADEIDREDRPTGNVFTLQSDGNSFDFFNGLLKTKA
ncbi:biotin-protein ligase [Kalaharituber pfeilii]|nr:biotin-protein ligase [Kalaharituber pfeilii]